MITIKAFTLAEVLITLAIVGVVAAVTIPSVIANAQQQEFKTGLRKAVNILNEAIQANILIEGETPYENLSILNYLKRHMVLATGSNSGGSYENDKIRYRTYNSYIYTADGMRFEESSYPVPGTKGHLKLHESGIALVPRNIPGCVTPGGCSVSISQHCGSYGLAKNPHNTVSPPCMILVDVNGDRKPNPSGVNDEFWGNGALKRSTRNDYSYPSPDNKRLTDVFNILITEDRAIPYGVVAQRAMYEK